MKPTPTYPGVALLSKLASVIVHADEMSSPDADPADGIAFRAGLSDPDVQGWLKAMTDMALAPQKRNA